MNKCKGCPYWIVNRCSLTTCTRKNLWRVLASIWRVKEWDTDESKV